MWNGDSLGVNEAIVSTGDYLPIHGTWELIQQSDGNLVLYGWFFNRNPAERRFEWSSGVQLKTDDLHTVRTYLQDDGNLCTYYTTPTGTKAVWCSGSATRDRSLAYTLNIGGRYNGEVFIYGFDPARHMRTVHKFRLNSRSILDKPGFIDV